MTENFVDAKTVLGNSKSSTWKYFKFRVADDDIDRSFAHCVLCLESGQKKRGAIKYCGGTTNLTNHLKSWHKTEFKLVTDNQVVSKLVQSETILDHFKSKSIMWPKSSEKWKKLTMSLAKWFCKNSRSTAMVEDEGFAAFMALACPSYELPSRKTLSKYIEELYQKEHKKIKSSLEDVEFCAITTDGGTSSNATSFQVLTSLSHQIIKVIFSLSS